MHTLFCPKVADKFPIFQILFDPSPRAESFSVSSISTRKKLLYSHNMYLTFPEELIFGTQNDFRVKDKRTLSQLCLHAIFLSLFQCSQRLFHTSLRRIALRKSKLLFVSVFFQAVFYILWCHQAVYQEHYCT